MSSFFQAIGRILQGKPPYPTNDQTSSGASAAENAQPSVNANEAQNSYSFPEVSVKRTTTQLANDGQQVYCDIYNNSREVVELKKIRILGEERELECDLGPNGDRQVLVYEGAQLQSPGADAVLLQYKTEDGRYFEALHDVKFHYNDANKMYTIDEINPHPPVRALQ